MAGLLDVFNSFEGQQALGLLAAASGRSDGAGFGQRLMEGLSQGDKWKAQQAAEKRAQMQEQMQQMQMQEYQQKVADQKKMQGLAARFATPAIGMAADGYGPSAPASFDRQGYAAALESVDPIAGLQYAASIQKQKPALINVAEGGTLFDPETQRAVYNSPKAPKEAAPTELSKLIAEMNALPNGSPMKALYEQQIRKVTTHQSPVSVSYGAPVAGVDDSGKPIFFQPGKNGGAPAIIPGVAPAGGAKLTEDQAKASGWLAQAEAAFQNMMKAKKEDPSSVLPGLDSVLVKAPLIGPAAANTVRSSARQRYVQGAGAFGEAALRAATGAGMNVYEAEQKIAQFTPAWNDDEKTIAQKEEDMKVFLRTLRPRATGKTDSPMNNEVDQSDPLGIRRK